MKIDKRKQLDFTLGVFEASLCMFPKRIVGTLTYMRFNHTQAMDKQYEYIPGTFTSSPTPKRLLSVQKDFLMKVLESSLDGEELE